MADGSKKIGSAYFEIEARVSEAERELERFRTIGREISQELEDGADGVGDSFGTAGEKIADAGRSAKTEFDGSVGAMERAANAAKRLQSVVSTVLIPAAVVGSVNALVSGFRAAKQEADALRSSFKTTADSMVEEVRRVSLSGSLIPDELLRVDVLNNSREQIAAIQKDLDQFLDKSNTIKEELKLILAGTSREEVVEEAEQQIARIERATVRRLEQVDKQIVKNRSSAIESARAIADAISVGESADPRVQLQNEIDAKIEQLKKLRADASDEDRAEFTSLIVSAYAEGERRIRELSETIRAEQVEKVREQATALAGETLSPIEQEIGATKRRLEEIRSTIAGDTLGEFDGMRAALQSLESALGEKLERLNKQQEQANKELPEKIGKAVEDGTRRVLESTGLLATAQTLAAIRTNADLILSETRRLAQ